MSIFSTIFRPIFHPILQPLKPLESFLGRSLIFDKKIFFIPAPLLANWQGVITGTSPSACSTSPEQGAAGLNSSIENELQSSIYDFKPETMRVLAETNAELQAQGKPPVDIVATTREIESITNDSSLSDKEKQVKIDGIRKRLGISVDHMKRLFTERLERVYAEVKQHLQQQIVQCQMNLAQAENRYGKGSPQAMAASRRLEEVQRATAPMMQKLTQNQNTYHSMYPPPGSCIKKMFGGIAGMFKGIIGGAFNFVKGIIKNPLNLFKKDFLLNVAAPLALNFIPGIGQVASVIYNWGLMAYKGYRAVSSFVQGKWEEGLSAVSSTLSGISSATTGAISEATKTASGWIDRGMAAYQKVKGWIDMGRNFLFS
jgi:hypothetical protein